AIGLEAQKREALGKEAAKAGNKHEADEKVKDASRLYDTALSFSPDSKELNFAAARTKKAWAEQEKNPDNKANLNASALKNLAAVLAQDKKNVTALKMTAELFLEMKKPDQAGLALSLAVKASDFEGATGIENLKYFAG